MKVVVDAYDEAERAMGWYYYLDEQIHVPFKAECIRELKQSPLRRGEQIEVLGMAGEDVCEHDMLVTVIFSGRKLAVPLSQLRPVKADASTSRAVEDWHYWLSRGYEF